MLILFALFILPVVMLAGSFARFFITGMLMLGMLQYMFHIFPQQ